MYGHATFFNSAEASLCLTFNFFFGSMPQYYTIFLKEKNLFYLEMLIIFPYLCFEVLKGGD